MDVKKSIKFINKDVTIIPEAEIRKHTSALLRFDYWGCLQVIRIGNRLVIPQIRIKDKPGDPMNYCLQINGSGNYFGTLGELNEYAMNRWGYKKWCEVFKYATRDRLTDRW